MSDPEQVARIREHRRWLQQRLDTATSDANMAEWNIKEAQRKHKVACNHLAFCRNELDEFNSRHPET